MGDTPAPPDPTGRSGTSRAGSSPDPPRPATDGPEDPGPPSQATAWGPSRTPSQATAWSPNNRPTPSVTFMAPEGPGPDPPCHPTARGRTPKPGGTPPGSAAATPEEEALEWIRVRSGVLQAGQQALAVGGQELGEQLLRHAGLVVGEQGAPDPLDHLVAGGQVVQVDLEPDVLGGQAEAVEQRRVPLRFAYRRLAMVAVEGRPERLGGGDFGGDHVRGVVVVGRHLHGQLAARVEGGDQPP